MLLIYDQIMLIYDQMLLIYDQIMLIYDQIMLIYDQIMLIYDQIKLIYDQIMLIYDQIMLMYDFVINVMMFENRQKLFWHLDLPWSSRRLTAVLPTKKPSLGDSFFDSRTCFEQQALSNENVMDLPMKNGDLPMNVMVIYQRVYGIFRYGCVSENVVYYPLYPMVLLIIIPFLNGYFIGNINPTFSDKPIFSLFHFRWRENAFFFPYPIMGAQHWLLQVEETTEDRVLFGNMDQYGIWSVTVASTQGLSAFRRNDAVRHWQFLVSLIGDELSDDIDQTSIFSFESWRSDLNWRHHAQLNLARGFPVSTWGIHTDTGQTCFDHAPFIKGELLVMFISAGLLCMQETHLKNHLNAIWFSHLNPFDLATFGAFWTSSWSSWFPRARDRLEATLMARTRIFGVSRVGFRCDFLVSDSWRNPGPTNTNDSMGNLFLEACPSCPRTRRKRWEFWCEFWCSLKNLMENFVWKCCVPHCTQWFCWSLSVWKMASYHWEYNHHY